jgi:hypothetical protein
VGSRTTTASGIARSNQDKKLELSYESSEGGPRVKEQPTDWEVVGQGRYGPVADWMIEAEGGWLEDSSGEYTVLFLVEYSL